MPSLSIFKQLKINLFYATYHPRLFHISFLRLTTQLCAQFLPAMRRRVVRRGHHIDRKRYCMLSLVSHGKKRTARRELQEKVLDTHSHVHKYAQHFVPIIQQETRQLLKDVEKITAH